VVRNIPSGLVLAGLPVTLPTVSISGDKTHGIYVKSD
jgi:hypothetical protein